jgi:hypothetical protein
LLACDYFSKHKILDAGVFILLYTFFLEQWTACGTGVDPGRYPVLQSSFGRTFLFYILHLAMAFHPRRGWVEMGMGFSRFIAPEHPAGFLHLARLSNGRALGSDFWECGKKGMMRLGSEAGLSPLEAGFSFDDYSFGETAERKSRRGGLFADVLCCCCCCCCCVCNTKIPQTIDLSSLLDIYPFRHCSGGLCLGFLHLFGRESKKKLNN